ncbi:GtrA family protein [Paracraurococcus ruber]|uniref:GtrA-like protein n=1 Tax=Paracraurococcus ruber TaxID=77675 RepID=A0ABS1CT00_9PROT|nr:GtrA family protein [Paracraurococcus ruber]MBK1657597.1 GtrA-like protein [Paracraurococcus ruber]TDG30313.1 GtrA family protein [Paracraurococcus ruber]
MTALPLTEKPGLAGWAARLGPARLRLLREFFRFGVVGTVGFLVDAAVLMLGIALGLGPWLGRALSYLVGATTTFTLNRLWTFRHAPRAASVGRQWVLFLLVNLVGFACNYGTYAALIAFVPVVAANPVLGVAAGSIAGLAGNFVLSRRFVFGQGGNGRPSHS